ncbi:uncharacterized protein Z519_01659 [Cladophialophora bantiana CBS 173.52]|uniref:Uncharacterized protein n=1 Tax=Cladophialophora bantiana (strain ATCC 10958 / CBS 173.52 / CDC B-1940 / NIH 8579) TaxID=1442370 RepID=A0A0D2I4A9_CLAB1|nr:uncharacterized protein Z519_01659 [Cladophialophora bantiana CBS 173.52]KIW98075.1 hypothetical protein Z519_01659 [Cladophialophora bantiana CBS 173.52]
MDGDGARPPRHTPPYGQPSQHRHSVNGTATNLLENKSPPESDRRLEGNSLENAALELYADILLSRAHFLLFNSDHDDVSARENLFDRGKEVLEEAVLLCLSGQYSVSKALVGKCWYLRGFLADVSGDDENALRCFIQATNLDENYKSLQRVRWHLRRHEDVGLFEAWDEPDLPAETRDIEYRSGEPDSDNDTAPTTSTPSSDRSNFRQSDLYHYLMYDINHKDMKEGPLLEGDSPPVTTSYHLHHLPPIATPYNATMMDSVDALVQEIINGPGAATRASRETHEALKGFRNSPVKDPFLVRLEDSKKKAKMEAEDRMRHIQEARARLSSAHSRRLSGPEILLSDTPSIREEHTPITHAEDGAAAPPKLLINTRGIRRPSTSSKSSGRSPGLLSPLRKTFLPGDVQDDADGSSC